MIIFLSTQLNKHIYFNLKRENYDVTINSLRYFEILSTDSAHADEPIFYFVISKQPLADIGFSCFRKTFLIHIGSWYPENSDVLMEFVLF